jgi:thiol-disulfide isomerase/thioredoxin
MDDSEAAFAVLETAFNAGLARFEEVRHSENLAELDQQRLGKIVSLAHENYVQRMKVESKKQLEGFEPFGFSLKSADVDAENLDLESIRGKIVIIDYWGTWCPLCREKIVSLIKLKNELESEIEIIGLAYENGDPERATESVQKAMAEIGINYRCVLGDLASREAVPDFPGFPTTLFLDRFGKVRMMLPGHQSYEKIESIVTLLIDEDESGQSRRNKPKHNARSSDPYLTPNCESAK